MFRGSSGIAAIRAAREALEKKSPAGVDESVIERDLNQCATVIQSAWRGYFEWKRYRRFRISLAEVSERIACNRRSTAAVKIQKQFRGHISRRILSGLKSDDEAKKKKKKRHGSASSRLSIGSRSSAKNEEQLLTPLQQLVQDNQQFLTAMALYLAFRFDEAIEKFEEFAKHNPSDRIAERMALRCRAGIYEAGEGAKIRRREARKLAARRAKEQQLLQKLDPSLQSHGLVQLPLPVPGDELKMRSKSKLSTPATSVSSVRTKTKSPAPAAKPAAAPKPRAKK